MSKEPRKIDCGQKFLQEKGLTLEKFKQLYCSTDNVINGVRYIRMGDQLVAVDTMNFTVKRVQDEKDHAEKFRHRKAT